MMQHAVKAVRQRWPMAATVTATATALALAGLQAYGTKDQEKQRELQQRERREIVQETSSSANADALPGQEKRERRTSTSSVRMGYFKYLVIPLVVGITISSVATAHYFDVLNVKHYPSRIDMLSRCILWIFLALQILAVSPFLTRSYRLHSFRLNMLENVSQSTKIRLYFILYKFILALVVFAPYSVFALEYYSATIDYQTFQLYTLLAGVNVIISYLLELIYSLTQLNTVSSMASEFLTAARKALHEALKATKESQDIDVIESSLQEIELAVAAIRSAIKPLKLAQNGCTYGSLVPAAHAGNDQVPDSQPSIWSGFYNKTLRERYDVLSLMYPSAMPSCERRGSDVDQSGSPKLRPRQMSIGHVPSLALEELGALPSRTANLMIENCIGVLGIPLGLGLNFVIDGKSMSIPMAVEEPSVVAAASSAAKLIASYGGGFHTQTSGNIMTSQIQLLDTPDIPAAIQAIETHRKYLIDYANTQLCANMKRRGGGVLNIYARTINSMVPTSSAWYSERKDELTIQPSTACAKKFVVVHIDVDVCEAMGANIVNTIAEGLSAEVARVTNSRAGLRILTNLCVSRRARSSFSIPIKSLGWKGAAGATVAQRIIEANDFAINDPFRAVTNNKGILNGIDAAAVATGQDWRAIEAAAHCYASRFGQYTSLTKYAIEGDVLTGTLELPMSVGSKGGALQTHPGYAATHAILGRPSAQVLSGILVCVGLAQNFAAIRALAITGINQGHMALHARNIAVAAGAPNELVAELCAYMLARGSIRIETAKAYLTAHAVYKDILSEPIVEAQPRPSMFYVEVDVPGLSKPISVNLAFLSLQSTPQTIIVAKPAPNTSPSPSSIQTQLLGDKGYIQLQRMFMFLAQMKVIVVDEASDNARANLELQNKLLLLSILLNVLTYQLMRKNAQVVYEFISDLLAKDLPDAASWAESHFSNAKEDPALSAGLPLLLSIWQVFNYHIDQEVSSPLLQQVILQEQCDLLDSIAHWKVPVVTKATIPTEAFAKYMEKHAKRWQATMFLLVDCLALDHGKITTERITFVKNAGRYIEWEGTVAHDMARFERALHDADEPNVCVWFKKTFCPTLDIDSALKQFQSVSASSTQEQHQVLYKNKKADVAKLVHLGALDSVMKYIQAHYTGNLRKHSF
ncbi:3-hydroxy-3-methylglutaryl-coenzyme A reductase [Thraustotheca clavata]|uniref:3-hydroxy-3-methylglutaryl-coenzyme A reductase n=1 Tax=Thraustotheca clavata TaxID=74557 RepID=A0A1V9Y7E0_9STRA|nr:3-hydroxy-3-methylglutaryl-coenzyme A reductase [Thraustotheca clavata]